LRDYYYVDKIEILHPYDSVKKDFRF